VFAQALGKGWQAYVQALVDRDTVAAIRLTLLVAAISVPLNITFGLAAAVHRQVRVPRKALLNTLIDLPFPFPRWWRV
jgi:sulfate transport system permease protein